MQIFTIVAVLVLVLIHIFINRLRLSNIPRSKWLSIAGGISVAYIFIQVFSELQEYQESVGEEVLNWGIIEGRHTYLFALIGLTVFYGLERLAKESGQSTRNPSDGEKEQNLQVFWLHIASFSVYNFLIGYLLHNRAEYSTNSLMLFTIAMAFHLIVNDHGLEDHYRQAYEKRGRWILVAALVLGWLTGALTHIPEEYIGVIFSFIAGGVIMNVMKEELPQERDSNYMAFAAGVVFYSLLLLSI